jgi:hypothetical protein
LIFGGIVVAILTYSAVFSPERNDYPVQCMHEVITGKPCPSCGLSHSFSYIMRGDLENAVEWNIYGPRVFLFFILQLVFRASIILSIIKKGGYIPSLVWFDITISLAAFVIAFGQFISYFWNLIF